MRHLKAGRKFRRYSSHQKAMFANLVTHLLRHERVQTTDAKAKELRRVADKTIHWGVQLGELLIQNRDQMKPEERARLVHAIRMARRVVRDREVLQRLFDEVAPRYLGRAGGYTRVVKVRHRIGDAAPISLVELVGGEAGGAEAAAGGSAKAAAAAKARGEGASRDVPKARTRREAEEIEAAKKAKKGKE